MFFEVIVMICALVQVRTGVRTNRFRLNKPPDRHPRLEEYGTL